MPANWLHTVPAIPLEASVPIRSLAGCPAFYVRPAEEQGRHIILRYGELVETDLDGWRVDLDHSQGFAYALRLLSLRWLQTKRVRTDLADCAVVCSLLPLAIRWLAGFTTDDDRVALARVLTEITR